MMTTQAITTISYRKDWGAALAAVRRLIADANDTTQVFRIMRALNAGAVKPAYDRLLKTSEGGRIAYERVELAELLSDPDYVNGFAEGSVGAAYAAFLRETGYSAQGLAEVSRTDDLLREAPHPYNWLGRRTRDLHDIWHILTGYRADDPLGEACLTGFSYAQTGGLGWALIASAAALRGLTSADGKGVAGAIWQGYCNGRRAAWLLGEDIEALLAEPLESARKRLKIAAPTRYEAIVAGR